MDDELVILLRLHNRDLRLQVEMLLTAHHHRPLKHPVTFAKPLLDLAALHLVLWPLFAFAGVSSQVWRSWLSPQKA